MDKLETMTGRTDHPVTSRAALRSRTSFASRLARATSADEWPQIIAEYENRKAGGPPRYHYVGHRPLNETSHALMDESWARGPAAVSAARPEVFTPEVVDFIKPVERRSPTACGETTPDQVRAAAIEVARASATSRSTGRQSSGRVRPRAGRGTAAGARSKYPKCVIVAINSAPGSVST